MSQVIYQDMPGMLEPNHKSKIIDSVRWKKSDKYSLFKELRNILY
jgi:hypothetical protein